MDTKRLLLDTKIKMWSTSSPRELADDYGVRLRQTKKTRDLGPDVVEIAASGYYEFQQDSSLSSLLGRLEAFCGLTFHFVNWDGMSVDEPAIYHERNQWPASSWAYTFARIGKERDA